MLKNWVLCAFASLCVVVCAEDAAKPVAAKPKKSSGGPPIPIHSVEGTGGILFTQSAYIVNPAEKGKVFGLPSLSATYLNLGDERELAAVAVTQSFWDRLEFSYAYNRMSTGDFKSEVRKATDISINSEHVELHNFNLRGVLIKDGAFNEPWLPQISAGVHVKYNPTVMDIDKDLAGTLRTLGVKDDLGVDFTLYASKLITKHVFRPILVDAGVRATKAAHIGMLGFTQKYNVMAEGNVGLLAHDKVLLGMEYRMKPNQYNRIPGLLKAENDWWGAYVAFLPTKNISVSAGYGHFGGILNHQANRAWGLQFKWEF